MQALDGCGTCRRPNDAAGFLQRQRAACSWRWRSLPLSMRGCGCTQRGRMTSEAATDRAVNFTAAAQGVEENDDNRAFYALLSTPNVLGITWLLVQHKPQLGLLYVDSIYVWYDDVEGDTPQEDAPLMLYVRLEVYSP
jgi:hypothetical protein